jgi:hypothetical protein
MDIHVDCGAMSHPTRGRMTKFHVSCFRARLPADLSASSLGSVPYPTATIFKEHFQVTVCSHRTQTLLALYAREKLDITPIGVLLRIVSVASQQTVRSYPDPVFRRSEQCDYIRHTNLDSVCKEP